MDETKLNLLEQIVTEIETNLPENVFQQYLYYKGLVEMYSEIVKYLNGNMEKILSDVIDNDIKDDNFEVIYPAKMVRKVNIAKLNEQYPEVYNSLAFVETNKVLKLVDRSVIRKFILSNNSEAEKYVVVNIGDVEKVLGKTKAMSVIDVKDEKSSSPTIIKAGESKSDYYKLGDDTITRVYIS